MAVGATDDNTIIERFHGKIPDREEYQRLKNHWLKPGDTLVIYDLEALGGKRSARQELEYYRNHGIRVKILDIPTTTICNPEISDMIMDTVISTLDYVISHEIERTRKRQTQGVDRIRDKPAWRATVGRKCNFRATTVRLWRGGHVGRLPQLQRWV